MSCTAKDLDPDFILLTESWCSEEISDAFLTIPGYDLQPELRQDREDTAGGRGGGLLVYTKTGVEILALDKTVNFNQYCKFSVRDVTVYLLYRPPSGGQGSIADLTNLVRSVEERSILIGDFNLPEVEWSNWRTAARSREFLSVAEEKLLEQMVNFPTHTRGNMLDLVLTNIPERVLSVEDEGRLGHSDHVMLMVEVAVDKVKAGDEQEQLCWAIADWDAMRANLREWSWRPELEAAEDSCAAWAILREKVKELINAHVPRRRKRNQNKPAWLSRDILRAIRRKKRLWRQAKLGLDVEIYKEEEKRVRKLIKNAKRKFEKDLAEGGGKDGAQKRRFFAYVKKKTKSRPAIGPLKDAEGRVVKEDKPMADILNEYFSSVFTREDTENLPEARQEHVEQDLQQVKVTVKKVKDKIRKLRQGSAGGPDGIGTQLLKELESEIASPLTLVMRRSVEDGHVPEDWRTANVTPIFKKGSKHSPANYRPVSLTSVCGKILESIIKDEIMSHLNRHGLLRKSQHGFMSKRSCTTNLLSFLERVTEAVDTGEAVDVIFLDFAKAFDKVPIQRLLLKVKGHGIGGQIYQWIAAWLTNRRQRVVLNGKESVWAWVLSGVPQGSVLGPILFLIFINDLDLAVEFVELLRKFADDTKIAQTIRSDEDRNTLQAALDSLLDWAARWGMTFNVQKCKVMHVGRSNPCHQYSMAGTRLERTTEERDLGVIMSDKLKPSSQCAKAARTAQTVLGQIIRAFHFKDKDVFVQLYKTYVRPHLEFSTPAWSPWTVADKDLLEKVQRKAIRQVTGLRGNSYEERLAELGMVTLEERRHRADMAMTHQIVAMQDGGDRSELFTMATEAARVTRTAADPLNVRIRHGRLDIRKNFFTVRVTEPWNNVPSEIKSLCPNAFKNAYARHRDNIAE